MLAVSPTAFSGGQPPTSVDRPRGSTLDPKALISMNPTVGAGGCLVQETDLTLLE